MKFTDENGKEYVTVEDPTDTDLRVIKPVKKTEEAEEKVHLQMWTNGLSPEYYNNLLFLTPTTAHKLSEAISALVEYVQKGEFDYLKYSGLDDKIQEARESFQESQ